MHFRCDFELLLSAVAYGLEKMNREVSHWMRGLTEDDEYPEVPFIATKGYDSVVWNRLYSRDVSDLESYQISQVISHPCSTFALPSLSCS